MNKFVTCSFYVEADRRIARELLTKSMKEYSRARQEALSHFGKTNAKFLSTKSLEAELPCKVKTALIRNVLKPKDITLTCLWDRGGYELLNNKLTIQIAPKNKLIKLDLKAKLRKEMQDILSKKKLFTLKITEEETTNKLIASVVYQV